MSQVATINVSAAASAGPPRHLLSGKGLAALAKSAHVRVRAAAAGRDLAGRENLGGACVQALLQAGGGRSVSRF
jgi:hypothetical protein